MDFFDKYKFSSDNPDEFGIDIKKFKKSEVLDESHLSNLLSHSIRITKDILPNVTKSINTVFQRLEIENQFNFFVTADSYQANAACSLMSVSSKPDIILTSKLIDLLSDKELEFVIGHEVAHYIYQHALYPNHQNEENRNFDNTDKFWPTCEATIYQVTIFNRQGREIWNSEYDNHPWDGKLKNGRECKEGPYFYKIEYVIHPLLEGVNNVTQLPHNATLINTGSVFLHR